MPTWGDILVELQKSTIPGSPPPFDAVRRKYLAILSAYTKRNTVLYATFWNKPIADPVSVLINDEDMQGFMEVFHGLHGNSLDIILHSPGGQAESAEAIVSYVRSKFSDVRVIVPQLAMSAATMLACSANEIVMGKHSSIGPIDPQLLINDSHGVGQSVPAQAILDQFEMAKEQFKKPVNVGPWLPILEQYGPALLVQCEDAINLSKELVQDWLARYMFSGQPGGSESAEHIARYLANHTNFRSHSRHINAQTARSIGLKVRDLESDQSLQDKVLSVFHATNHTFGATGAVKIIENHEGKAFIKQQLSFSSQGERKIEEKK